MIDRKIYDLVCESAAALTEAQRQRLRGAVIDAIGAPVSGIFPRFAVAFPETVAVMERKYAAPIILFRKYMGVWMPVLVAEGPSWNIFFDLVVMSLDIDGPDFEHNCAMLPTRWKELYRFFWSFEVTEGSTKAMDWTNTPFSYCGRLMIERYRILRGVKKSVIRDFVARTDADSFYSLHCWLLTDGGDALFLDEKKCDKKIYHVKNDDFADYRLLDDPETVLDRYLAYYLTTGSSEGFDFRA